MWWVSVHIDLLINCLTGPGHLQDHSTHLSPNPSSLAPAESLASKHYSALPVVGTCQFFYIQLVLVCTVWLVLWSQSAWDLWTPETQYSNPPNLTPCPLLKCLKFYCLAHSPVCQSAMTLSVQSNPGTCIAHWPTDWPNQPNISSHVMPSPSQIDICQTLEEYQFNKARNSPQNKATRTSLKLSHCNQELHPWDLLS